jgi:hypothetical protein
MAEVYDRGDVLRVTGTYTNAAGTAVDPVVVRLRYRTPSGAITTITYPDAGVVRVSAGVYYGDIRFTESGRWVVRHESTGTGEAATEKEYYVKASLFPA